MLVTAPYTFHERVCTSCQVELQPAEWLGVHGLTCARCGLVVLAMEQLRRSPFEIKPDELHPAEDAPGPWMTCVECGQRTTPELYRGLSNIRLFLCKWCDLCQLESIETLKLISFVKEKADEHALLENAGREIAAEVKHRELWRSLRTLGEELTAPAPAIGGSLILPIAAERGTTGIPWTTLTLIAVTLATCVLSLAYPEQALVFALSPLDVRRGHHLYQLISHAFLHAGVLHLLGNMFFLWLFGPAVEERLGGPRFVGLYFLLALAAGMGLWFPAVGPGSTPWGAAGRSAASWALISPFAPLERSGCWSISSTGDTRFRLPRRVVRDAGVVRIAESGGCSLREHCVVGARGRLCNRRRRGAVVEAPRAQAALRALATACSKFAYGSRQSQIVARRKVRKVGLKARQPGFREVPIPEFPELTPDNMSAISRSGAS